MDYKDLGQIKFDILDKAGQERYRFMTRIFYKYAKVVIFELLFFGMKDYDY